MTKIRIPLENGYLKILEWCHNRFGPINYKWNWTKEPGFWMEFQFLREEDAILFSLRWS